MLNNTQHSTQSQQPTKSGDELPSRPLDSISAEEVASVSTRLWRGRALRLVIGMGVSGVLAFVFWSIPLVTQLPLNGRTLVGYVLVSTPSLAAILAVLLVFVLWWYAVDYGWLERFLPHIRASRTTANLKEERARESVGALPKKRVSFVKKTRKTVRTRGPKRIHQGPIADRIARRRRQLYGKRVYRGTTRVQSLHHLRMSFPSLVDKEDEKAYPIEDRVGQESIVQVGDEDGVALQGVALLAAATENHSVGPVADKQETQGGMEVVVRAGEAERRKPLSLYLLNEFVVEVQNDSGVKKSVTLQRKRRGDDRYTARDLLALLGALRGKPIGRLKLLESVFGYGLSDTDKKRQPEALRNQLNKATQYLRDDINEAASSLGLPELKVIGSSHEEWFLLTSECRVVDLDEVDASFSQLEGTPPQKALEESAQQACERLIKVYKGSFMERYIEEAVQAGHDEWDSNWMRTFYTEYLKKYLLAVWYRAEYWRIKGDMLVATDDASRTLQRTYYETAAKLYEEYVDRAVPGYSDQAAMAFSTDIEMQSIQAERALRSCLDMYTATGNTQAAEPVYQTFCNRMVDLWSFLAPDAEKEWGPSNETRDAWKNLNMQTKAHRKAGSVTPHELPASEVRRVANEKPEHPSTVKEKPLRA